MDKHRATTRIVDREVSASDVCVMLGISWNKTRRVSGGEVVVLIPLFAFARRCKDAWSYLTASTNSRNTEHSFGGGKRSSGRSGPMIKEGVPAISLLSKPERYVQQTLREETNASGAYCNII